MTTVVARALNPRVAHATCLKPSCVPTPPMVSLSRPQFTCVPGDPCRHAVGGTPPQDGTCTAPTLGAGWCRVIPTASGFHGVELCSTSSCLQQAPHRLFPEANPALRDVVWPPATSAPPSGGFFSARAAKERRQSDIRALTRTSDPYRKPTHHPLDPGGIPSVPSSKLGKHTPHSAPREAARCRPVS